jgi:hypothetical protein
LQSAFLPEFGLPILAVFSEQSFRLLQVSAASTLERSCFVARDKSTPDGLANTASLGEGQEAKVR